MRREVDGSGVINQAVAKLMAVSNQMAGYYKYLLMLSPEERIQRAGTVNEVNEEWLSAEILSINSALHTLYGITITEVIE